MTEYLTVTIAPGLRRDFAVWAREQTPKVMTNGAFTSAVPADLFQAVPVELLAGALVDGQPWDMPDPEQAPVWEEPPARMEPEGTSLDAFIPKTSTRRKSARTGKE